MDTARLFIVVRAHDGLGGRGALRVMEIPCMRTSSTTRSNSSLSCLPPSLVLGRQSPCLRWALRNRRHVSRSLLSFWFTEEETATAAYSAVPGSCTSPGTSLHSEHRPHSFLRLRCNSVRCMPSPTARVLRHGHCVAKMVHSSSISSHNSISTSKTTDNNNRSINVSSHVTASEEGMSEVWLQVGDRIELMNGVASIDILLLGITAPVTSLLQPNQQREIEEIDDVARKAPVSTPLFVSCGTSLLPSVSPSWCISLPDPSVPFLAHATQTVTTATTNTVSQRALDTNTPSRLPRGLCNKIVCAIWQYGQRTTRPLTAVSTSVTQAASMHTAPNHDSRANLTRSTRVSYAHAKEGGTRVRAAGAMHDGEKDVTTREGSPEAAATPAAKDVCGRASSDSVEAASFAPSPLSPQNVSQHHAQSCEGTAYNSNGSKHVCLEDDAMNNNNVRDDALRQSAPNHRRHRYDEHNYNHVEDENGQSEVRPRKTRERPGERDSLVADEGVDGELARMHELAGETYDEKLDDALSELESRSNMLGYQLLVGAPLLSNNSETRNNGGGSSSYVTNRDVYGENADMMTGIQEVLGDVYAGRMPATRSSITTVNHTSMRSVVDSRNGGVRDKAAWGDSTSHPVIHSSVTADSGSSRVTGSVQTTQALPSRHGVLCPVAQDESQEIIFRR